MKVRDLIALLVDKGWALKRQRGSHRQFKHLNKEILITVAGKPGSDMPTGTLNKILRDAGLKGAAEITFESENEELG